MENNHVYGHQVYKFYENFFDEEENVLSYRPGGYHPIILGDTLENGRYKICHKLGYGSFSTVWVAKDNKLEQWVSIKIVMAVMTNQSRELHNLRALTKHSEENNFKLITQLLDDFIHEGPNGYHQCLVFELLGPTINVLQFDYFLENERNHWKSILDISTQLLQALDFIHKAGYAHGDLNVKNLVFDLGRLSHLSEEELLKKLGFPISAELIRLDGKSLEKGVPSHIIESAKWDGWLDTDDEEYGTDDDIRLIDFGESFFHDTVPEKLAQPLGLRAPETILADKFDYRMDLWSAGLLLYYLTFGSLPLGGWKIEGSIASMINFLGELPPEWQPKWEQLKLNAEEDWERVENKQSSKPKLERRFDKHVHEPELKVLFSVIKGLTKFLPSDRISASQALDLIKDSREKYAKGREDNEESDEEEGDDEESDDEESDDEESDDEENDSEESENSKEAL